MYKRSQWIIYTDKSHAIHRGGMTVSCFALIADEGVRVPIGTIPNESFSRGFIKPTDRCVMSIPIHCRFNFSTAAMVVPQPQKGSKTISRLLEEAEMIRSRRATGF
jgi:hypothetical protein